MPLRQRACKARPHRARRGTRRQGKADRLFDFPFVGPLDDAVATDALVKPAEDLQVTYEPAAIRRVLDVTRGYPYFLQEWGKHGWDATTASPITEQGIVTASTETTAALDESLLRVHFDRMPHLVVANSTQRRTKSSNQVAVA